MQGMTPFLMFVGAKNGKAEEALRFYVSLFKQSRVVSIERYGAGEQVTPGYVKHAKFVLGGQEFEAMDGGLVHAFVFTPAMSLSVLCETEVEIGVLYKNLSGGGTVHISLDRYPFGKKFAWVDDRYGVSWQLKLF